MADVTAKVYCGSKVTYTADGTGQAQFAFYPDHQDEANRAWAAATPTLQFQITVRDGDTFTVGRRYTVTFSEEGQP